MEEKPLHEQQAQGYGIAQATGGSSATVTIYQAPAKPGDPHRQQMLAKVRAFWISGVLEQSLHGAAPLVLRLQEQPDMLVNPWGLVVQESTRSAHPLPPDLSLLQIYDEAGGELLILGAPGSGKTTLLLQLAGDLLDRAEREESHPIPVVFNLSSWAVRRQPLLDWLAEELHSKYQVSHQLAHRWLAQDQILPLLDSLDEVLPEYRAACLEAINSYRQEHGLVPMVVCSRSSEYMMLPLKLQLQRAVLIQPLTQQQIDEYLSQRGQQLEAVSVALHEDTVLQELATTPLMLHILALTYQGQSVEALVREGSLQKRQQQIFEHYIEQMLARRGASTRYMPKQTLHWLSYLAAQMKRQSQTVFYLEQIQPDWLSGQRMLRAYCWWAIWLPGVVMGVLVSLAINALFYGPLGTRFHDPDVLVRSTLLGGLLGGLLSGGSARLRPADNGGKARRIPWQQFLQQFLTGFLVGLGILLSDGLRDGGLRPGQSVALSVWLILPYPILCLCFGLGFGLCSLLLYVLLVRRNTALSPFQLLPPVRETKWQRLIRSAELRNGLLVGLLVGLSFWLSWGLVDGLIYELGTGLYNGLNYGFIGGVLSWLLIERSGMVQVADRLVWSWTSLRQSLLSKRHAKATLQLVALAGLSNGVLNGLGFGLSHGFDFGLFAGLNAGLRLGLGVGLCHWLLLGLFEGVSSETIEDQRRVVPNQGIRHSVENGLVLGLVGGMIGAWSYVLSIWLGLGLSSVLSSEVSIWLRAGLSTALRELRRLLSFWLDFEWIAEGQLPTGRVVGLSVGLLVALLNGGLAALRHYLLRFLLCHAGAIPRDYVQFLDYCAERILLRKVGGGYIFLHRLLLEYFASLSTTSTFPQRSEHLPTSQSEACAGMDSVTVPKHSSAQTVES